MQPQRWKDQRGVATVYLGVSILALMAVAALGVDIGRIAFSATEVQSAADAVATTGARQLLIDAADPYGDAVAVLGRNGIDGDWGEASQIQTFETGNYNWTTGTYTAGGTPANAVRAVVQAEVNNILTAVLQQPSSTVTKSAIAAYGGLGAGKPTLPLTAGDCLFPDEDCFDQECLPTLFQVPSNETSQQEGENSAFTGFFETADQTTMSNYFPSECGGSETPPTVRVGQNITLNNGQIVPLLNQIQDCLDAGITEFLIPTIECGEQLNQEAPVVSFVTVTVSRVVATGDPKFVEFSAVVNEHVAGPAGGEGRGSGVVALVN